MRTVCDRSATAMRTQCGRMRLRPLPTCCSRLSFLFQPDLLITTHCFERRIFDRVSHAVRTPKLFFHEVNVLESFGHLIGTAGNGFRNGTYVIRERPADPLFDQHFEVHAAL